MADIFEDEELYEPSTEYAFATVVSVNTSGLVLRFDGCTQASNKEYKCNSSVVFSSGDRVKVIKCSGTYIAEYVIGKPGEQLRKLNTYSSLSSSATLTNVISRLNLVTSELSKCNILWF